MRRFLLFTAAYFAGAWYSSVFVVAGAQVTLMWPPAGIAFIAAVRYGPRWSLIAVAPILLMHALSPPVPAEFLPYSVASNVLGVLAGYYACASWRDPDNPMSMRNGFALLAGGLVMSLVSALIGTVGLVAAEMLPKAAFAAAFTKWTLGDLLGVTTLGPLTLLLTEPKPQAEARQHVAGDYSSLPEKAIWLLSLAIAFAVIYLLGSKHSLYAYGLTALPLGLLLWSAIRFEPAWSIAGTAVSAFALTSLAGLGLAGFPAPVDETEAAMLLGSMCVFANVPITLMAAVTQQRAANRRALRRATVDEATGLRNRSAFEAAVRDALADDGHPRALAYLDLDHLSVVNDTASHAAGDVVLHGVASLLRAELGGHGEVFRIGGDEFALLLPGPPAETRARIEHVREAIERYRAGWQGRVLNVTASVGFVSFGDGDGDLPYGELLSLADAACITAKELGGNRVCVAGEGQDDLLARTEAMRWAVRIREALDRGRFELHCQSIVALSGDADPGLHFEFLLRMRDPDSGRLLSPGQFIPAAERFQLGVALDRHVVELALGWLEAHPDAAARMRMCAINLTAASMVDETFRDFLIARVRRSALPANRLCFEITETSAVRDLARAEELIRQLRALGCAFALDDFGTGFCSFDYLGALDVDYLKIDGSFIRNLADSELSAAVVRAIADIAHVLHKKTIAEQVENEAAFQALRRLGIDHAQGYYMHRPQPLAAYFAETAQAAATAPVAAP